MNEDLSASEHIGILIRMDQEMPMKDERALKAKYLVGIALLSVRLRESVMWLNTKSTRATGCGGCSSEKEAIEIKWYAFLYSESAESWWETCKDQDTD